MQRRVRFNKAPKKVPEKVPGGFGAEPGQVQQGSEDGSGGSGRLWCRGRSSSTGSPRRFRRRSWCRARSRSGSVRLWRRTNTVPEKGPEKVWEALVQPGHPESSRRRSGTLSCRARSGSTDKEKVPKKVPGSLGAKLSQFQWVPEKALVHSQVKFNRVSEKVWEALVPEKVPGKVWEALVQSQVRFHRVPQNIPEKVVGSLGAKPSQVQRVPGKVAEAKPSEVHLTQGNLAEVFPALGFPARFRKIYKNKALRLLGIPPKLKVNPGKPSINGQFSMAMLNNQRV